MKQTLKMVFSVVLFSMICWSGLAQNAERTAITGKVVDKDGLGVIGLNVLEKGTKHGVLTDIDGNYKIQVPKGAVLQFSYIGMKMQERTVGTATSINITMQEDASALDEVVVVGYGSQKKEHLTGAIATIKPDELERLPVTNLAESLRGQIPGLSVGGNGSRRPGETADLSIRQSFGFATNAVSSLPLVVIDDMVQIDPASGMPTLETFNRLDPSEIESITVLKDGSAAIYGARAAQGAIVVKTKRGKAGKTKFSYTSQFSINDAISHGKTMSAYESGIYSNRIQDGLGSNASTYYSEAELEEMKTLNYNWLDKAWKASTQQRHVLNVSGGNEEATYFAGVTYLTQGANLGEQDYKKWNFRTGVNAKISKNLDMSLSVSGNSGDIEKSFTKSASGIRNGFASAVTNAEQADYGFLLHMPKFIPITTTVNGEEYFMSPFPSANRNLGGNQNTNNSIAGWNYFATLDSGSKQVSSDFSYNVNGSLTYKVPFIKGLSFRGSYAISQTHSNTEQVALPFTLARIRNFTLINQHLASAATPDLDSRTGYTIADNKSQARVVYDNNNSKSIQTNFFANYKRTFGDHDVDAMFSVERSENEYNFSRLYYENPGKDYLGTHATAGALTSNSQATRGEGGTLSYLGRLSYSYKSKYLLQFLFRQDASTKFAPENYWGKFPSAQVGWIISKESWFEKALPMVDHLKFRYSIGKTGKDNVASWKWATYYDIIPDKGLGFGSNGGLLGSALAPRPNPNRNVGWDTTIKQNFGIDFNVFDNRLQITADYYYDKSTDMLTPMAGAVDVPISVGGGFTEQNFAAVNGWGSEFAVKWNDRIKDNFSYNIGVNFGFSNNEVKKYPEQAVRHPSFNTVEEGASMFFPSWGFKVWNGTSTGDGILRTDEDIQNYWNYLTANANASGIEGAAPNYLGQNNMTAIKKGMLAYQDLGGDYDGVTKTQGVPDGKISKNLDYAEMGRSRRTYGFTTNFGAKYKGFFIQSQIATSWGGTRMIDVVPQYTSTNDAYWSRESFWTDMYGADNVDGKYPNLAYREFLSDPSDFWKVNTFRCTVRNLTLGFDFPKEILSQLKISNASLGVTGYNLWDLYNPYPDKYRNMYDSSVAGYPTLRTWSINLNITF